MSRLALVFISCFAFVMTSSRSWAQSCDPPIATAVSVQGSVEVRPAGATDWQPVRLKGNYCPGDTIRASERSRADLSLANQSTLRVRANTEIVLEGIQADDSYLLDLLKGAAHFLSRGQARNLDVKTPFATAGVRGTEFFVGIEGDATLVTVYEGSVLAENSAGSVLLRDGQSAIAERGRAPALRVVATPRDAVRWTLYFLPVLDVRPDALPAGSLRQSADAYLAGDLERAFEAIEGVAPPDDARFFAYRASLLLAVGSPEEAEADIERALAIAPNDADALSLQTIIAVVQNEKERAFELATLAVGANPDSAAVHLTLSYARQARFDLEGARASLEEAVRVEPNNALAWARLSEVRASFGELGASREAAERALALNPSLSRTQTVLGFAALLQVDTERAKIAFEKAIDLDSADPLPRLGLGLAKIREGALDEGARELEVAASLDPSNALVRSYLGKAYFEEKRTGLDEREYDMAKKLDPKDPTPWFYDAIAKQTTNRPVEALKNLQKAIELNDNRAVYRSRLLLDSDSAARSASLGRIYADLGFQNLALVEGWKSVNTDSTNHSAHRLLADSYAALPRHEIARVSELLQSQLLQPNNTTPIQPQLAESSLFLVSAQGPSGLAFNEFNPLFNRDQVNIQASGVAGEEDTVSGEGIISGIKGKASFSAGYGRFRSEGFRDNNEQDDEIANAFVQLELNHKTSIQAEYRHRDLENDDLELRFFAEDFSPFLDEETRSDTIRLGLRHAFSPGSVLLASYIYQDKEIEFDDAIPDFGITDIDLDRDETANSGEVQHHFRSGSLDLWNGFVRSVNIVSGAGHFDVDSDERVITEIDFFFFQILDVVETEPDVEHTNLYAYSYISLPYNVTVTLGLSGDFFDEDDGVEERNQANPKFGVTWNPWPDTTVRLAAFRVLKRTLVTDQTLEPTQVAGFNQFYDDASGTEAVNYGVAIDQKFGKNVFGGVEFVKRDLDVPFSILMGMGGLTVERRDWDEYLGRAYLFWTPCESLALSAGYQYEKFERDIDFPLALEDVTTHRVPLGVQYFHRSGLSASVRGTYIDQDGEFELRIPPFGFPSANRDFWIVDAAIRYRLPKRYGFLSVGVRNMFDEDATYQATDVRNPTPRPGRVFFAGVTLAFQ